MEKNKCGNRYSPEVRERAVRMVFEHPGEFDSQSAAIKSTVLPKMSPVRARFSAYLLCYPTLDKIFRVGSIVNLRPSPAFLAAPFYTPSISGCIYSLGQ